METFLVSLPLKTVEYKVSAENAYEARIKAYKKIDLANFRHSNMVVKARVICKCVSAKERMKAKWDRDLEVQRQKTLETQRRKVRIKSRKYYKSSKRQRLPALLERIEEKIAKRRSKTKYLIRYGHIVRRWGVPIKLIDNGVRLEQKWDTSLWNSSGDGELEGVLRTSEEGASGD